MFKLGLEWPPFTTKPHRKNVAICHPAWSRAVALNAVQHFGFGTIIEVAQKKVRMDARQIAKEAIDHCYSLCGNAGSASGKHCGVNKD